MLQQNLCWWPTTTCCSWKKKCKLHFPENSTASSTAAAPKVKAPCVFRGTEITDSWKLVSPPLLPTGLQPGGCMLLDSGSSSVEACTPARKAGYRANHKLSDACAVYMLTSWVQQDPYAKLGPQPGDKQRAPQECCTDWLVFTGSQGPAQAFLTGW